MGIKGLWQALRPYVDDGHLSQFRGQRVAVDMYVWLHRCVHRSVRIRTEAVVAYLDAKYSHTTLPSGVESSSSSSGSGPKDDATHGTDGVSASSSASSPPPPLCVEDVLELDDQFLALVLDKVAALQRFGVVPVCVFDGAEMPMKGGTDEERQRRRTDAFHEALRKLELLYCEGHRRRQGRAAASSATGDAVGGARPAVSRHASSVLPHDHRLYEEAVTLMEKAVDISTELAHAVIQVLKEERHVECIVAPYEADAQLAFLCREGYVAAAASEDSDLIAYFCPCVISKLDTFSGKCEVLQPPQCAPLFFRSFAGSSSSSSGNATSSAATGGAVLGGQHRRSGGADGVDGSSTHARLRAAALTAMQPPQQRGGDGGGESHGGSSAGAPSGATSFTYESFLLGCIMSGCDYVPNLRGIGVKKAFRLIARATSLRECFSMLEREYGFPADELARYRHRILEAFYCFAHHLVYSPVTQELVTYHPLPHVPAVAQGTTAGSGTSTSALKTQLVGAVWPAQTAQEVCAQCLKDPCTLQLYQGTFHTCVARYLQRTRRGQTALTAFGGFQSMTSNRVVVHLSQQQQPQPPRHCSVGGDVQSTASRAGAREDDADFGAPLKRQRVAAGFIGDAGRRAHTMRPSAVAAGASASSEVVVVRSRFFMLRGRTAVQERWSDSGSDSDEAVSSPDTRASAIQEGAHRGDPFSALAHRPAHRRPASPSAALEAMQLTAGSNTEASATPSMGSADGDGASPLSATLPALASAAVPASPSAASAPCAGGGAGAVDLLGSQGALAETPDVEPYTYGAAPTPAESARPPPSTPATAACRRAVSPSQCNAAPSVFASCFLGQPWGREAPPPRSPPASSRDSAASSPQPVAVPHGSGSGSGVAGSGARAAAAYVPRAFRPPRSTAAPPPTSVPLHTREMNAVVAEAKGPAPRTAPAAVHHAIFEKMTFKKS